RVVAREAEDGADAVFRRADRHRRQDQVRRPAVGRLGRSGFALAFLSPGHGRPLPSYFGLRRGFAEPLPPLVRFFFLPHPLACCSRTHLRSASSIWVSVVAAIVRNRTSSPYGRNGNARLRSLSWYCPSGPRRLTRSRSPSQRHNSGTPRLAYSRKRFIVL